MTTPSQKRAWAVRRGRRGQAIGSREVRFPDVTNVHKRGIDRRQEGRVYFTPGGRYVPENYPHIERFTERFTNAWEQSQRHVVPSPSGGWVVKKPDAGRASSRHETREAAIARAREIVRNSGGGEVVIYDNYGRIQDSATVLPKNDPNPPRK